MKNILLLLSTLLFMNLSAQQTKIHNIQPNDPCFAIIDSLENCNYFTKAKQVKLMNRQLDKLRIIYRSSAGCLFSTEGKLEIIYNGKEGIIIKYRNGDLKRDQLGATYFKFTGSTLPFEIIANFNENFAFDSTLYILHPYASHITGQVGGNIKIIIGFSDGDIVTNELDIGNPNNCCYFLPGLTEYLKGLYRNSFSPMNYIEAYIINMEYNSIIASEYISQYERTFHKIIPLPYPKNETKLQFRKL